MAETPSNLQRWLRYIDEQLSSEAVEYLKLGLHSEFSRFYSEVEKLDKPSLLYNFLLERCKRQSESQALKIFLHVVRGLGGTLRGNSVISNGFGRASMFNVKDPGLFDIEKASVNFKFFQCLLKIATKARNMALGDQLKKKFSKDRFLNTNHRHIQTLPELFIRLYQKGLISGDNTHHLVEALSKYKAWVCLQILNSYHKSVGLQPIALAQKMEKKFGPVSYSSSDPSSMEESAPDTTATDELLFRKSFHEGTELDSIDESDPIRFSYVSTVHSPMKPATVAATNSDEDIDSDTCIVDSTETEKMIKRHKDAATGQLGVNGVVVMSRPSRNSKLGCRLLVSSIAILLLLVVISITILLVKVWIPLRPPTTSQLQILNGSTIIVKEIDSLFHGTVDVGLDTEYVNSTDFYHSNTNIDFFGAPGPCSHIYGSDFSPKQRNIYVTEKNISSYIPEYALKGSTFNYQITGHAKNMSNVEFVDVCLHRGSAYNTGTQIRCKKVLLKQDHGLYEVPVPDYYFFKVNPLGEEISDFELHIDGSVNELHVTTHECQGCSINTTNEHCRLSLPLKTKFCLMAEFYGTRLALASITLDVQVEESRYVIMLITPIAILSFLVLFGCFIICTPLCCFKFCNARHSMVAV